MPRIGPPAPAGEPLVELGDEGRPIPGWRINPRWLRYMNGLRDRGDAAPFRYEAVAVTGQTAAIGVTAIPTETLTAGLYRVTALTRVTTVDGTSSSVQVTITWTRSGTTVTEDMPANTSDVTSSGVSGTVLVTFGSLLVFEVVRRTKYARAAFGIKGELRDARKTEDERIRLVPSVLYHQITTGVVISLMSSIVMLEYL